MSTIGGTGIDFRLIRNYKKVGDRAIDVGIILNAAKAAGIKHYKDSDIQYGYIDEQAISYEGGRVVAFKSSPPSYTRCVKFVNGIPIFAG